MRTITTRLEGFVERLHVDYTGQLIKAGQPLLSLYAPMAVSTQEELVLARRLARDVAGGTPEAVAGAQASIEAARQRLRRWDVPQGTIDEVERTGTVQPTVTLRAPYAGYVLEKTVLLGQRVMPGDPLYKVADLSVVWLEGEIFELVATQPSGVHDIGFDDGFGGTSLNAKCAAAAEVGCRFVRL